MDDRNDTIEWAIRYIEKVSDMTRTPEKQNLLAALKALDVPETPPEEEQELVRRIQSHGTKLSKNASGQTVIMDVLTCTEEKGIALLSAYADSIRKQCADRAVVFLMTNTRGNEMAVDDLRAAIMRKE